MGYENHMTSDYPNQLFKISAYWEQTRTCVPIKSLPDELQAAGIDWKYYSEKDHWMNALQAIRHDRLHACDLVEGPGPRELPERHQERRPARRSRG